MFISIFDHEAPHLLGENATHPIAPPDSALAALLLLAGRSQLRRKRLARPLPDSTLGRVQLPNLG